MTIPAYTACQQRIEDVEQVLESLDATRIRQLAQELDACLTLMKQSDSPESPESGKVITEPGRKQELAASMVARIEHLTRRISGIMALQRDEMNKLKLGQETARGYAMGRATRTGAIINSAN